MNAIADRTSGFADVEGVRLHYRRRDSRPPALLPHGVSDNGACRVRTAPEAGAPPHARDPVGRRDV